jgi:hypothetical protein
MPISDVAAGVQHITRGTVRKLSELRELIDSLQSLYMHDREILTLRVMNDAEIAADVDRAELGLLLLWQVTLANPPGSGDRAGDQNEEGAAAPIAPAAGSG